MFHNLFIHSTIVGRLNCFQFGASGKNEHSFVCLLVSIYTYVSLVYACEWKCLVIKHAYIQLRYISFKEKFIDCSFCHASFFQHLLFCGFSYGSDIFVMIKKEAMYFL